MFGIHFISLYRIPFYIYIYIGGAPRLALSFARPQRTFPLAIYIVPCRYPELVFVQTPPNPTYASSMESFANVTHIQTHYYVKNPRACLSEVQNLLLRIFVCGAYEMALKQISSCCWTENGRFFTRSRRTDKYANINTAPTQQDVYALFHPEDLLAGILHISMLERSTRRWKAYTYMDSDSDSGRVLWMLPNGCKAAFDDYSSYQNEYVFLVWLAKHSQ